MTSSQPYRAGEKMSHGKNREFQIYGPDLRYSFYNHADQPGPKDLRSEEERKSLHQLNKGYLTRCTATTSAQ